MKRLKVIVEEKLDNGGYHRDETYLDLDGGVTVSRDGSLILSKHREGLPAEGVAYPAGSWKKVVSVVEG